MNSLEKDFVLNSAKSTALMGVMRGYYIATLMSQKELTRHRYLMESTYIKLNREGLNSKDKKN